MIKYAELNGYRNLGELSMLSHVYQFVESNVDTPIIILINTNECTTKVYKGLLFTIKLNYTNIPLTTYEREELEKHIGKINQVGFVECVQDTIYEEDYKNYVELKE